MTKSIQCDIVSAHEEIFSGEAAMVFASGIAGELGIAPRHAPLITQLKAGPVRVQKPNGEEEFFFVSGGILEVQPHMVTVLTDTAMRPRPPRPKRKGNWPTAAARWISRKPRPS